MESWFKDLMSKTFQWGKKGLLSKNIATGETSQVITSRHFSSLLFTSMSILTSLALINWKANTIHIHISNNSTFPFISLHFILSLLLSIERQKQYEYIKKAIQKAHRVPIFSHTYWKFLDTQALQKVLSNSITLLDHLALRWCHLY